MLVLIDCRLFFQAEDGIRDISVTGVQTCALPIWDRRFFGRERFEITKLGNGAWRRWRKRRQCGMNSGRTVFAQRIDHLPHKKFQKCVARYCGDSYAKNFSCWDQYLAMAFAQFTYRESLRDIETCLGAVGGKLRSEERRVGKECRS